MPEKYVKEMVADWRGAGLAQGQADTLAWYHANKHKIILHPATRSQVEQLLYNSRITDSLDRINESAAAVNCRYYFQGL
ncbi:MAG TPA: hypothetical protein DER33_05135 [Syntrophomonas sp.]|nr:hypothetical protein [Syntrophomonas sp.]